MGKSRYVRPSVRRSVYPVLFFKVKNTHTRRVLCRVSGLVQFCECPGAKNREYLFSVKKKGAPCVWLAYSYFLVVKRNLCCFAHRILAKASLANCIPFAVVVVAVAM